MKIAQVLMSGVWGAVTPDAIERGIGGREGAMLNLSKQWAQLGHEVTNFVNVEKGQRFYETMPSTRDYVEGGYHEYIPLNLTRPILGNFPFDWAIAWECPSALDHDQIRENIGTTICEMQVAHFNHGELQAAEKCDYIAALSDWHGEFLLHQGLDIPKDRVITLPNGINTQKYNIKRKTNYKNVENNYPSFVYSSSPDRGLHHLLRAWPLIRKEFRKAELYVCYGLKDWADSVKWSHGKIGEVALDILSMIKQPGVRDLGKIGQSDLAYLQLDASAWLYPFDPIQSTETGCITAIENAAAGNPIITTDGDCMEEEFGEIGTIVDLPVVGDEINRFVEASIEVLRDRELYEDHVERGLEFAKTRDWRLIAKQWLETFAKEPCLVP